jgi:hypothetical protein
MDATKFLVGNMMRSMAKKLEIEMLYGQMGYATVASAAGPAITITTAEWAPGIWAGSVGMPLEIRDSTGATIRGTGSVYSVNMDTRVVTLESAISGLVSGDVIWHKGAYGNEFAGVHRILTQASGTLFNIPVAQYELFRGNQYDALSGALSFTKMNLAAARAVEKGLDSSLLALINVRAWANILSDQAALRKYDQSYTPAKAETGAKSILFHSQNGEIEIEPSIYVKEGYAYLLSLEEWCRVGSADMTFKRPAYEGEFFREAENAAGYELRLWSDQALFCYAPGRSVIMINVVNSA